jgi:hypothetical protein
MSVISPLGKLRSEVGGFQVQAQPSYEILSQTNKQANKPPGSMKSCLPPPWSWSLPQVDWGLGENVVESQILKFAGINAEKSRKYTE